MKQLAELAPWKAVAVDDDRPVDQLPCPPEIPPLRVKGKPDMVNVVAVASEPWLQDIPHKPLYAAYYAGRLWNAVSWLHHFAALFHIRLEESVLLEIGRIKPYFLRACECMRSHAIPALSWSRLHDSWLSWLRSDQFLHHLESVWLDPETGESKGELDADDFAPPSEVQCLQVLEIKDTAENPNLISAMELGITVDRALRCWHTREGNPSPRFRDPWIDESAHCADAAWSESIRVQTQVLGILEKATIPDTLSYAEIESIDRNIREDPSGFDFDEGDKRAILGLVLNKHVKAIRRIGWDVAPIELGDRFPIIAELAKKETMVYHQRMKVVYAEAGLKGNYKGSAFSRIKSNLNEALEKLGVEIAPVRGEGWKLVELQSEFRHSDVTA